MLRFLTAGETHGKCLVAILEGMCSNLPVDKERINKYPELYVNEELLEDADNNLNEVIDNFFYSCNCQLFIIFHSQNHAFRI